jgi:hypothetical protein
MQAEVLSPAVKGTLNVLQACSANNVRKVIVVSSTAAVHFNPSWPQGIIQDESCWSDKFFCTKSEVSNIISVSSHISTINFSGLFSLPFIISSYCQLILPGSTVLGLTSCACRNGTLLPRQLLKRQHWSMERRMGYSLLQFALVSF